MNIIRRAAGKIGETLGIPSLSSSPVVFDLSLEEFKEKVEENLKILQESKALCQSFASVRGKSFKISIDVLTDISSLFTKNSNSSSSFTPSSLSSFFSLMSKNDSKLSKILKEDFGWEILKIFDDLTRDCESLLSAIQSASTALDNVNKSELQFSSFKSAKEKRSAKGIELTSKEESLMKSAEESLIFHQKVYREKREEVNQKMKTFSDKKSVLIDELFIRFVELLMEINRNEMETLNSMKRNVQEYRSLHEKVSSEMKSHKGEDDDDDDNDDEVERERHVNGNAKGNGNDNVIDGKLDDSSIDSSSPDPFPQPSSSALKREKDRTSVNNSKSNTNANDNENGYENIQSVKDNDHSIGKGKGKSTANGKKSPAPIHESDGEDDGDDSSGSGNGSENESDSGEEEEKQKPKVSNDKKVASSSSSSSSSGLDILGLASSSSSSSSSSAKSPNSQSRTSSSPSPSSTLNLFDFPSNNSSSQAPKAAPTKSSSASPSSSPSPDAYSFDIFHQTSNNNTKSQNQSSSSSPSPSPTPSATSSFDPLDIFNSSPSPSPPAANRPPSKSMSTQNNLNVNNNNSSNSSSARPRFTSTSTTSSSSSPSSSTPKASHEIIAQQKISELAERDSTRERESELKRLASQNLEGILTNWEMQNGVRKPIRTLLVTLHTVLWPMSGWKKVDVTELLDPSAIKKAKRKADLIVHPDKLINATPEQKATADRVFGALNEAFKRYSETGQ